MTRRPLFRQPDFRRLFLSATFAKFGHHIGYLALPLVAVLTLDASAWEVGLLGAMSTAAFLLIGLPAGAWVDRMRRRPVMVTADLIRAVVMASVPIAWWYGELTMTQLYTVALVAGVGTVFFDVASQSFLPRVVSRDDLTGANSALVSLDSFATITGRGVGGYLVQWLSAPIALAIEAVGFLVSASYLAFVRAPEPITIVETTRPSLRKDIGEGVRHVLKHPGLGPLAICGVLVNLFMTMLLTMAPIMLVSELGLSAAVLGGFLAIGGAGGLVGAMLARRISRLLGSSRAIWMVGALAAPGALTLPFMTVADWWWLATPGWALLAMAIGVDNVLKISYRQAATPDRLLGRMNATFRFLFTGIVAIGAVLAGGVAELFGTPTVMWIAAAGMATSWLSLYFSIFRRHRDLPTD
ncbi:MFS transporter [Stackebrandtia soli]|uniref:MFS transporter n=1 Tax=Stackebrandtia soli TaxID=1892856 RepID=UPI0039E8B052